MSVAHRYWFADSAAAVPGEPPGALHVWWGQVGDTQIGLMTDRVSNAAGAGDPGLVAHLVRVAGATKVLSDTDVATATRHGAPVDVQQASTGLTESTWHPTAVDVDGQAVPCAWVEFAGVNILVGNETSDAPFVMVRASDIAAPWPALTALTD